MTRSGFSRLVAFVCLACGRLLVTLVMMFTMPAMSANEAKLVADPLPLEISPQAVKALEMAGIPFVLVDAENHPGDIAKPPQQLPDVQHIFYAKGPGFRVAREKAQQSRGAVPSAQKSEFGSRYLAGTPLDWRLHGIKFGRDPMPTRPVRMTVKQLEHALQDKVDMDIVDLRSPHLQNASPAIPGSRRLLPHQIESDKADLSKQRWLILVDNGDGVAWFIAERLHGMGYLLIALLDGGYPAWVGTTQR